MAERHLFPGSVCFLSVALLTGILALPRAQTTTRGRPQVVFNVRDYGATGRKAENAGPAIQSAVDACSEAEGGMVYLPPGEYM